MNSEAFFGRGLIHRRLGPAARLFAARPFEKRARRRLLIYFHDDVISFAQVYPFLANAQTLSAEDGISIRCLPISDFLARRLPATGEADRVLIQPWFTVDPDVLSAALEYQKTRRPDVPVTFLDSYAHNDLRLGRIVEPFIDYYLKKSLFRDRTLFLKAWKGDTNIREYYSDLYGIPEEPLDWQTPPALLDRLRLSPNFLTAPHFQKAFSRPFDGRMSERDIDVHSRLGIRGTAWYSAMRNDAADRIGQIKRISRSPTNRVNYKTYMAEMQTSRLCFSPFGYGELCWRDIEAFQSGAVLIKPDMGHLETLPDLYEPGVTYFSIAWDFSDLAETVERALSDTGKLEEMARTAYNRCRNYLNQKEFIKDHSFLFT